MTGSALQQASVPRWQRPLLPGGVLGSAGARRSARDWLVDVAMFAIAVGVGVFALVTTWSEHGHVGRLLDIVLGLVALGAIWRRRERPVGVAVLALVCAMASGLAAGAGLVALFNAAIRSPARVLVGLTGLSIAGGAVYGALYPGGESFLFEALLGVLFTAVTVGWGLFARAQRDLVRSLHERARQLEADDRLRVARAREAERRRIAREMHDVLAHRVSLLSLHAGALEFRPDAPPQEIAAAAGVIRGAAHAALEELRDVIGVLRDGADDDAASQPPQPTLAQIPALVQESRDAGMRVECRIDVPDAGAVPATVGRTAYRVVQEGLTNARKHAPAANVEVALDTDGEQLVVAVVNREPVSASGPPPPGAGTGLIGLAERVALVGGELEHGRGAGGDFLLRARLPRTG